MRAALALALLSSTLAGACYAPNVESAQYRCDDTGNCPQGTKCNACGQCMRKDDPAPDRACACAFEAARAEGDPGLARVAFCRASWLVPGVATTDTPCNRKPGPDGLAADRTGEDCTIEDNCAAGWHVCDSAAGLTNRELAASDCLSSELAGFWATRVVVDPKAKTCSGAVGLVGGCGTQGAATTASSCGPLRKAMDYDLCSTTSDGWACGSKDTDKIGDVLIRNSARLAGGVICCRD